MPGAVDNEDYEVLNITQGVYAAHPSLIPDGFSSELDNIVIRDGIPEIRYPISYPSYSISSTEGYIGVVAAGAIPDCPNMIHSNIAISSSDYLKAVGLGAHLGTNSLIGISNFNGKILRKSLATVDRGGIVAYNSTLYATSSGGVYRLGVGSFPTSVTETLVASSPTNLDIIITHKSRLFGAGPLVSSNKNRLYFTDAPAVGQLPGDPTGWNTTVNFIDFNSQDGPGVIWALVSLNNYIYVFTDQGLFSVYTSGGPSNWTVKVVNPNIFILGFNQVIQKSNLIYFVTDSGVFVTDGFDFKNISQGLSEFFNGIRQENPLNLRLGEFNGGLLLAVRDADIADAGKLFFTKVNNIAWTTFSMPLPSGPDTYVFRYFTSVEVYVTGLNNTTSYICAYFDGANAAFFHTYDQQLATITGNLQDNAPQVTSTGLGLSVTGRVTRAISVTWESRELFGSNFMRLKNFKELFVALGSGFNFTVAATLYANMGITAISSGLLPSPGMGTMVDTGRIFRFSIGSVPLNSIRIRLVFSITTGQAIPFLGVLRNEYMFTFSQFGLISMVGRSAPLSRTGGLQ